MTVTAASQEAAVLSCEAAERVRALARRRHRGSSVRTYRTWLLRVRDALAWSERGEAAPARMHAEVNPHQPYTAGELAGLRHWAMHLPRQQKTDALGLGAGLGLTPREVAASRGRDLRRQRRDGPLMHTAVDRLVPLVARAAWDTVLGELADQADSGYLFRPRRTTEYSKNLIGSWSLSHRPPDGLPAVSAGRSRVTWIVELMRAHIDHHLIAQADGPRPRSDIRTHPTNAEIPPSLSAERDLVTILESDSRTVVCGPVGI
ncbi:hypothetical protein [Streptomyces sp. NBC_00091]|uniref:hypothetical protein n=1 Tax=Streptomyces sp. NBC_00091 TaxID=2975648 RepID=UPI00224D88D5|nr:hypothetical protein [Streptomyces sp. NBC_00091]MCX5377884.1 hypothetical protein [Streptomyces sp. NBC_00091]